MLFETLLAYNLQWNVFLIPKTKNKADGCTYTCAEAMVEIRQFGCYCFYECKLLKDKPCG